MENFKNQFCNFNEGSPRGRSMFPNNPRAQELITKQDSGLPLTTSEQKELEDLWEKKFKEEAMVSDLDGLWGRVGDPNVVRVSTYGAESITVLPKDQEKVIWTFGLVDCFSTLVFSKGKDYKFASLTHFPPAGYVGDYITGIHLEELRKSIRSPLVRDPNSRRSILIFGVGSYKQNSKTGLWEPRFGYQEEVDMFTNEIQNELGQDVPIQLEPYSLQENRTHRGRWGAIIVRLPPRKPATYRTWFNEGQL